MRWLVTAFFSIATWATLWIQSGQAQSPVKEDADAAKEKITANDPLCITWKDGWIFNQYSVKENRWFSWQGPDDPLTPQPTNSRPVQAIGQESAAVILPGRKYSGWLFNYSVRKWFKIPESPIPIPPRNYGSVRTSYVGRELIVWGYTGDAIEGAVLDTETMRWKEMAKAPLYFRHRFAHQVIGKHFFIWGGYGPRNKEDRVRGNFGPVTDGALYNVEENSWEKLPDSPLESPNGCASVDWKGRFVLFGERQGKEFAQKGAIYDPATKSWEKIPGTPLENGDYMSCVVANDQLFVFMGSSSNRRATKTEGAFYDFNKKTWEKISAAPLVPRAHARAHVTGDKIIVWGGWTEEGHTKETPNGMKFHRDGAIYDPKLDLWKVITDLPETIPDAMHLGW